MTMPPCRLDDLPPAPAGRQGWPWTEGSPDFPPTAPGGQPWPRISIVTPSYNQGSYIEETIRSVLLQGYPNLEFLIMDGGSTDETVTVIRRYERWLTGWVSERDRGQSDAINKGFARSTGQVFNWLCSDDLLKPGALQTVARAFCEAPECDVVAGSCYCDFEGAPEKGEVRPCLSDRFFRMPYAFAIWQPSCFFRRDLVHRAELVRTNLHYCMDRELWCYLWSRGARWQWRAEALSVNRFTGSNKSTVGKDKIVLELDEIYSAYVKEPVPLTFWLRRFWLPLVRFHHQHRWGAVRAASRLLSRSITVSLHSLYPRERVKVLQEEYYMYTIW